MDYQSKHVTIVKTDFFQYKMLARIVAKLTYTSKDVYFYNIYYIYMLIYLHTIRIHSWWVNRVVKIIMEGGYSFLKEQTHICLPHPPCPWVFSQKTENHVHLEFRTAIFPSGSVCNHPKAGMIDVQTAGGWLKPTASPVSQNTSQRSERANYWYISSTVASLRCCAEPRCQSPTVTGCVVQLHRFLGAESHING